MLILSALLALASVASAQNATSPEGCLRLLGSVACPGFQYAYLSPSNLSNAFPFFQDVTDVRSFDAAALNYFSDPYQFRTTKFINQLGCTNASSATIRYQRTVLCSMWVNEMWSEQCMAYYNGSAAATSQKMVCQETCLDYAASELALVNSTTYCPGPDLTNGNRSYQLNKDYVDCTDWTTLQTNDTATCVLGSDNESNCGYGTSTTELCDFCRGDNPDDCCYAGSTDMSVCGYVLPSRSSTSASPSSTGSAKPSSTSGSLQDGTSGSSSTKLSGGQIAGIVVGSVLGGLLLLALLAFLLIGCLRRRRNKRQSAASFGNPNPGHGGMFGFLKSPNGNPNPPHNSSEKGLLGTNAHGTTGSSPTMGGDTLYAQSGHGKSSDNGASMFTSPGTAASAFVGGNIPGDRTSGVVLPRVRDENQGGNIFIETGSEVAVLWPYQASLPDELDLRPGMKLRVLRLYDDAWGTAEVIVGGHGEGSEVGKQGAFPIVCVSEGSSLGSSSHGSIGSH